MTIAHSARKIIKTQRFIFRALPALLVSIFVLNACAGAVPVTVSNSSLSEAEIAKLRADAKQANDAKETADSQIVTLKDDLQRANDAKTSADNDVTRLKNDAIQAGIAKTNADSEIKILKGQLSTAIGERGTANGMIATLKLQLQQAMDNQNPDDSQALVMLRNQLSTATGAKEAADLKVTQLTTALRLIEEARINFADWGGTAEAPKTTVKNAAGTGTEPLLNGAASVVESGPTTNFIQGLATLDGKGFDFAGTPFVNARVSGGILLLAENSPSGVAFSLASGRFYAGLLPTTNLGALITDINTSAIWDANIMAVALADSQLYSNPSFKMQVIFDGNEGTINSGTVSSGVFTEGAVSLASVSSNTDISIQGRFGSDGLLYGTVNNTGTLTGLIGAGGAVGVFFNNAFAGGFVAYPTTIDPRVAELEDELRLAEEARLQELRDNHSVIEFTDWAGTAEEPKTTVKNARGTGTLPLLNGAASISDSNPALSFIQGLPTLAGQGFDFTGTAFADADVLGDVLLLGENSPSGVAFSRVTGTGVTNPKYYAGLLPTTNLGAPITDINTSAIWDAKIMLAAYSSSTVYSNSDFKMRVTFDGSVGTINSGTVSGGVFTPGNITVASLSGVQSLNIEGNFGSDGLLYGSVRDELGGGDSTGLIGVDGAVGTFTGATFLGGIGPFAGGFVAYPTDPRVAELEEELRLVEEARISFADWGGTAENPKATVGAGEFGTHELLLNGTASVGNSNPLGNFIQGLPTIAGQGFDFTGTVFSDATVVGDVLLLAENSPSGVAFSGVVDGGAYKYYAGLLPTTNLGALITDNNTSAIWDAKAVASRLGRIHSNSSFKMQVIFNGSEGGTINSGTVSGGVFTNGAVSLSNSIDLDIEGRFVDGLLYGKVNTHGRLTGLIGEDGAVGTFTGATFLGGIGPFAGGFVAYPTDPRIAELEEKARLAELAKKTADDEITRLNNFILKNYNTWEISVNPDRMPNTITPQNQFLQSIGTTLDTTGVTLCPDSEVDDSRCGRVGNRKPPRIFERNLRSLSFEGSNINGDINDGYAHFSGYIGETEYRYAGIYNSTDLGAPLTGDADTSVQWDGSLESGWRHEDRSDFVLTINFESVGGRLDAFSHDTRSDRFWRFENVRFGANGVITGTVNRQYFMDSDPTRPIDTATDGDFRTGDSVLSGIIGQDGLMAVFVGASAGGFIAGPNFNRRSRVDEVDWTRKVGDIFSPAISAPRNQFLRLSVTAPGETIKINIKKGVRANSDGTGTSEDITLERLSYHNATFNGNLLIDAQRLIDESRGGSRVVFYSGYIDGTRYYYSGLFGHILASSPFPVWETGQNVSAVWKGQLSVLQGANARADADLTLDVDFQNRRLTAFVPVGTNHYLLDAGFNVDDDGFFLGTVKFGAFTDTINRTSTNTLTSGVLTGIIGRVGASGVFVSGSTTDNGRTITGGTGEDGFAGGFIACPALVLDICPRR